MAELAGASLLEVPVVAPGVRAAFSTRVGGVSTGAFASLNVGVTSGDDPQAVRANRARLGVLAGFDPARAVALHQVHGHEVVHVGPDPGDAFLAGPGGVADADALSTDAPGVALMVQGADCVPVLLWRADGARVAAAHAGWRGLVDGVLAAAVGALGERAAVGAAIGPCIGPCCYPVDHALRERMAGQFGEDVVTGDAVDLRLAARRALVAGGVASDAIIDMPGCTACDADRFFSYRRDGERTGRQAGVIWMEEG